MTSPTRPCIKKAGNRGSDDAMNVRQVTKIEPLDALRGLAALLIVLHHYMTHFGEILEVRIQPIYFNILTALSSINVQVVHFFFILSGFCIALSVKGRKFETKQEWTDYFSRRVWRILPLYFLAIAFSVCILLAVHHDVVLKQLSIEIIGNLLFLQTSKMATPYWFAPAAENGPLWSISFEVFYYALLPFVYVLKRKYFYRFRTSTNFAILLALSMLAYGISKVVFIPWLLFFSFFPLWFLGYYSGYLYLKKEHHYPLFLMVAVTFIGLYCVSNVYKVNYLKSLSTAMLLAVAFHVYCHQTSFSTPRLIEPIVKFFSIIGAGSYAIYVMHFPFIRLMTDYQVDCSMAVVYLVLFVIVCIAIDIFSQKYLRKWIVSAWNRVLPRS
ncbi:MAG: acyltransferase [Gemmataceae bacterium]